jgi:hypothetical protein
LDAGRGRWLQRYIAQLEADVADGKRPRTLAERVMLTACFAGAGIGILVWLLFDRLIGFGIVGAVVLLGSTLGRQSPIALGAER